AARNYMEANLVARRNFALEDPGSGTNGTHGCLVLPCLLPYRGRLLDAIIAEPDGAFYSVSVAGWIWAADQGARIINYSFGSRPGAISRVQDDGFRYLAELGAVIFISAGNDSTYGIGS